MRNQIKAAGNSPISMISVLFLACCWVTIIISLNEHEAWTETAIAASLAGVAVLIAWLTWLTYVLATRKKTKEMALKPRRTMERFGFGLLVYCLITNCFPVIATPWIAVIAWIAFVACLVYFLMMRKM